MRACVHHTNDMLTPHVDLPLNAPAPEELAPHADLVRLLVGDLPVKECWLSAKTKKLLVRLDDSVTQ